MHKQWLQFARSNILLKTICIFNLGMILTHTGFGKNTFQGEVKVFPNSGAINVNPDTYLQLSFNSPPILNNRGKIRIYDLSNDQLVDELDMAIAPGPKNTRTPAPYDTFIYKDIPDSVYTVRKPDLDTTHRYQLNYIGSKKSFDAYHFYPVMIEGHSAKIFLHNNSLAYDKTYYVLIDSGVFAINEGKGFKTENKNKWVFSTKKTPPEINGQKLVVAADGTGDFTTIQGALDFIPEDNKQPVDIYIRSGTYTEIINFRNRNAVSIIGEDRSSVVIQYPNNSVFNRKQVSPDPVLNKGIHNIRAVMAIHDASEITIANLTLRSMGEKPAQAEALLVKGDKIIVDNVSIEGSGDALQATGRIYVNNSKIQGFGDNVLGYGAVYFNHCEFVSTYGPHIWVRNTNENHGNVLVNCTLRTIGGVKTHIARAPDSNGKKYPYAEVVLIHCKVKGIRPDGWGKVTDSSENVRYWEYNTRDLETGELVDVSERHPVSRQLTMENDATLISQYQNPAYVLNGWIPPVHQSKIR